MLLPLKSCAFSVKNYQVQRPHILFWISTFRRSVEAVICVGKKQIIFVIILLLCGILSWAEPRIIVSHAITLRGEPKYQQGFTHFDYVNPDAPKGGTLTLNSIGTYDNFHRFSINIDDILSR